jgi:hypothetical protein
MKLTPRGKLLLLMALFAMPVVASVLAYNFLHLEPTANYGELITPPVPVTTQRFAAPAGGTFAFAEVAGKWALVASDSGACEAACREKLVALRQVRLALGRNAERVERVFVVDDTTRPTPAALEPFPGMAVAMTPTGMRLPPGLANDRAHVYLVDPHGNVMMRWPWPADTRRLLKDLERLLKASQIG